MILNVIVAYYLIKNNSCSYVTRDHVVMSTIDMLIALFLVHLIPLMVGSQEIYTVSSYFEKLFVPLVFITAPFIFLLNLSYSSCLYSGRSIDNFIVNMSSTIMAVNILWVLIPILVVMCNIFHYTRELQNNELKRTLEIKKKILTHKHIFTGCLLI